MVAVAYSSSSTWYELSLSASLISWVLAIPDISDSSGILVVGVDIGGNGGTLQDTVGY